MALQRSNIAWENELLIALFASIFELAASTAAISSNKGVNARSVRERESEKERERERESEREIESERETERESERDG